MKTQEIINPSHYLLLIFSSDGKLPITMFDIDPEWIPDPENDLASLIESMVPPHLTFEIFSPSITT